MIGQRACVVIVEDEQQIRRFVRAALEDEGCRVVEADTAARGVQEIASEKPDLVILDLGLPDRDGVEVIRDVRAWSAVPVIILSARSQEEDKVRALDAGADDYLSKPFGVGELLARVRALVRRGRAGHREDDHFVQFGDVTIDLARRIVERGGSPVHLTAIEYRLLSVLVSNASRVLTHRQLLKDVWGPGYADSTHYLRVYIARLREKLERDATRPQFILTETGVGYRFEP
jgi:two-component system, OmpR family, KDP operon response regulator KdpE